MTAQVPQAPPPDGRVSREDIHAAMELPTELVQAPGTKPLDTCTRPSTEPNRSNRETQPGTRRSSGGATLHKKKDAEAHVSEIMSQFDTQNDGVLSQSEQQQLYRTILAKLDSERKKEAAKRNYDATAAIRDQIALMRAKIRALDCEHEERRQEEQKKLFQSTIASRQQSLSNKLRLHTASNEKRIARKVCLNKEKNMLETQLLAKELAHWPRPKPRYSKGLIEMRHAEMALSKDQRYEEARGVRGTTKVMEQQEYSSLLDGFQAKKDHQYHMMGTKHNFNEARLDETVKDMRWRNKRYLEEQRALQAQCRRNHERAMDHALKMEMHKVKGTTHNICLLYTSPSPRDRTRSRMPSSA
eukprot:TRINITY_DN12374_c0_g1_i1.p1 TRINITY_DN12374_c0_g1~~TRINITY_DN12374_c0_g1_i1.p1  ORF type:complete len:357 (+),score=106.98 TRINITY_DN12374_c0_g1_i1:219-1289(+)